MRLITPDRIMQLAYTNANNNEEGLIKDEQINVAQLRWIKPVLGNDYWDELEAEWDVNGDKTGLSANNLILFNKLEPCMAFFCKYELVPDSSVNQTSAGLQVINTEYSTPATDKQRGQIQDSSLIHAKTLLAEVVRWMELDANIVNYTTYSQALNVVNNISRRGGIVL